MATQAQLGPYRLLRELSRGGMGSVHEAEHVETGAHYALKLLLPEGAAGHSAQALARFRRESQALAALNHPHIVRVHAADIDARCPYLVQALLPGGTLAQRLGSKLSVDQSLEIALDLASGLEAAHAAGILHRDLKPENVLFDDRDEPRLVDFGLALELAALERLSQTGAVVGTPAYMSPEQALGRKDLDVRVDVYGLGALLYAMLSGNPPVQAKGSLFMILDAVASAPVESLRQQRPDVPPSVDAVILRALAKKPQDRYPSVAAFAEALRQARDEGPRARPWPIVIAASAGVALLGISAALLWRPQPAASGGDPTPTSAAPLPKAAPAEADRLLAEGDSQGALELAEQRLSTQPGDPAWTLRRGWARLLQGDLAGARADLGPGTQALRVARSRRELDAELVRLRSLGGRPEPDAARPLLRRCQRLAEDARAVSASPLRAPLLTQVQLLLARAPLHLGQQALGGVPRELWSLSELAIGMQPDGAGARALLVSRAAIKYCRWNTKQGNREDVARRLREQLADARRLPAAPAPFPLLTWAIEAGVQVELAKQATPAPAPPRAELNPDQLGDTERGIVALTCRRAAGACSARLEGALRARADHAQARESWTRAIALQRQCLAYLPGTRGDEHDRTRRRIVVLLLAARRAEEARAMLPERREESARPPDRSDPEDRVLELECDLLLDADQQALWKDSKATRELASRYNDSALHCLHAAYMYRRCRAEGDQDNLLHAGLSLQSARRTATGDPFRRLHLGWLTPNETEIEWNPSRASELSQREFLEQALSR